MDINKFPITPYIPDIIENIKTHDILVIQSPTGSGKSLLLPYILGTKAKVFVCESKSSINSSLYEGLKLLINNSKNNNFTIEQLGYTTNNENRFEDNFNNSIINKKGFVYYTTTKYILNKILINNKNNKNPFEHIDILILDDSSDIESSIIEYIWMYYYKLKKYRLPKLLITSATVDIKNYIDNNISVIELVGKNTYEIDEYFNDKTYDINNNKIYDDMVDKIKIMYEKNPGNYLVFCPGKHEIEVVYDKLTKLKLKDSIIIQVYANISKDALVEINKDDFRNKIIITTNVFESAITLDVDGVFDSMLVKMVETNESDSIMLVKRYISKESSIQRKGRIGRIKKGFYYAMMKKEDYDNLKVKYNLPIERLPIYNYIVKLLTHNIDIESILPEKLKNKYFKSLLLLTNLNIIEKKNNKWIITDLGKFVSILDINVRLSSYLYNWSMKINNTIDYYGIVISSIVDTYDKPLLFIPYKNKDEKANLYQKRLNEHNNKYFSKYKGDDDLSVYIKVWLDLNTNIENVFDKKYKNSIKKWTIENSINFKVIENIIKKFNNIYQDLTKNNYNVSSNYTTLEDKIKESNIYLLESYKDKVMTLQSNSSKFLSYRDNNNNIYSLIPQPVNNIINIKPSNILVLSTLIRKVDNVIRYNITLSTIIEHYNNSVVNAGNNNVDNDLTNLATMLGINGKSSIDDKHNSYIPPVSVIIDESSSITPNNIIPSEKIIINNDVIMNKDYEIISYDEYKNNVFKLEVIPTLNSIMPYLNLHNKRYYNFKLVTKNNNNVDNVIISLYNNFINKYNFIHYVTDDLTITSASKNNNIGVINLMLSGNYNINETDLQGNTALIYAVINNNINIINILMNNPNIDINIKNNDDKTALDYTDNIDIKNIIKKNI